MKRSSYSIAALLFSIFSYSQVYLSFKNETGIKVDSLVVGGIYIGTLERDSIKTLEIPALGIDSGHPMIKVNLVSERQTYKYGYFPRCGTEVRTVHSGDYTMRLLFVTDERKGKRLIVSR